MADPFGATDASPRAGARASTFDPAGERVPSPGAPALWTRPESRQDSRVESRAESRHASRVDVRDGLDERRNVNLRLGERREPNLSGVSIETASLAAPDARKHSILVSDSRAASDAVASSRNAHAHFADGARAPHTHHMRMEEEDSGTAGAPGGAGPHGSVASLTGLAAALQPAAGAGAVAAERAPSAPPSAAGSAAPSAAPSGAASPAALTRSRTGSLNVPSAVYGGAHPPQPAAPGSRVSSSTLSEGSDAEAFARSSAGGVPAADARAAAGSVAEASDPRIPQGDGKLHILIGATGSLHVSALRHMIVKLKDIYGNRVAIQLILTKAAENMVGKNEIPSDVHVWRDKDEWDTWRSRADPVVHIELRRWADILVIAPLSANTLGKIAMGLCDNLLTSVVRAWNSQYPILAAPAMVSYAYSNPSTKWHARLIKEEMKWIELLKPTEKVAGSHGGLALGGMMAWNEIVDKIVHKLGGYPEDDDNDNDDDEEDAIEERKREALRAEGREFDTDSEDSDYEPERRAGSPSPQASPRAVPPGR